MRAPAGALGEGRWGAFSESAEGTCGRLGDPALPGGAPGLGVAGSEIQPYREARRGWVWPARRSEPYLGDAEGTCGPRGLDPYREVGGLEG